MKTSNIIGTLKVLRIANCRGKKPVINDIKKARNILQNVLIEINDCEAREDIKRCTNLLWYILEDNKQSNQYYLNQ